MNTVLKKVLKVTAWTVGSLLVAVVLLIVGLMIWMRWGYYDELNQIKKELNNINGVKVVNIWGHDDITLEEISARISIEGKGEVVLNNLSKDVYRYPSYVSITEFGGYSFEHMSCSCESGQTGIGPSIDIGTASYLGRLIGLRFNNPKDVIENYDRIFFVIDSIAGKANPLQISPDEEETGSRSQEEFLFFLKKSTHDQDPIFNLVGVEGKFEYARTLPWKCDSCCKN